MSMTDDVGICNAALIGVGEEKITLLSDDNKRARACNERYADLRDAVLKIHPWNFAIKRQELVDQTLIKNNTFSTGIQNWTDSSDANSSIEWNSADKNIKLLAVETAGAETAVASQAFTLTATTTVTLKATLITTDAPTAASDNYIGIGTTATNVDQTQIYFDSVNDGEEIDQEVTLAAGTYYFTIATYNAIAGTYTSEFDKISLKDFSGINDNFEFENQFILPTDMLRIINTDMDVGDEYYKIENGVLWTNKGSIKIQYIYQVTDVLTMETLYKEALAARIGMELAVHLVDSDSRLKNNAALYKETMRQARFIDSQQGSPDELPDGRWLRSRFGFTNAL